MSDNPTPESIEAEIPLSFDFTLAEMVQICQLLEHARATWPGEFPPDADKLIRTTAEIQHQVHEEIVRQLAEAEVEFG